jgi:hypothetical protein
VELAIPAAAYAESGDLPRAVKSQKTATDHAVSEFNRKQLLKGLALLESFADDSDFKPEPEEEDFPAFYCYPGGYLAQVAGTSPPQWREGKSDFSEGYLFTEIRRDSNTIVLRDPNRQFRVRVPADGGMAKLSTDDGNTWQDLYLVTKEVAKT